jgi:hypothetical protein
VNAGTSDAATQVAIPVLIEALQKPNQTCVLLLPVL